jgi:Rrf2 family nitric oxide-sensitive transcriptional repressor
MRLTGFTDYTLRTLMYLALQPDRLVTIADIASAYNISANHLMKVVHQLSVAGDIVTTRGRRGGLRLARPPSEINVGAVVRRTEPDMALVTCFESTHDCPIDSRCVLQQAMRDALNAFTAVLDRYTVADLVTPKQALAELLGLPSPA